MSQKQLNASVRLNTSQAEKSLDRLSKKINQINKAFNNVKTGNLDNQLQNSTKAASNLNNKLNSANKNASRLSNAYNKVHGLGVKIGNKVREWASNQRNVTLATRGTNSALSAVWSKLKGIAATYLGIMGMRGMVNTTDTIISAENKLNYLNGNDASLTQEAMNKMYSSAQKVRMSYTDMMSNVSKSMVLAGDAFENNIDNAIRFQEIMAEAYAVGGASAAEMSSSMYQLIQALGAGTLAGDELRSVREGAPLAYKAIEKFAQGVYNTKESLKELGSQGKITSDMVVAAVMNAGDQMDASFAQTAQTFAQTWNQIKNVAVKAFEPIARMLRESLNKAIDNGLIQKIEKVFTFISKTLQIIGALIGKVFSIAFGWIAKNWDWLKNILITGLIMLAGYFVFLAAQAIVSAIASIVAWMMLHPVLTGILLAIFALIYIFLMWRDASISTCEAIVYGLIAIGIAVAIVGILMGNWIMIVIGLVIILLGVMFNFFEQVCGGAWVVATFIGNLIQTILNMVVTVLMLIMAIVYNVLAFIANLVGGVVMVICTILNNLFVFIVRLCQGILNIFVTIIMLILVTIYNAIAIVVNLVSACASAIGAIFYNAFMYILNLISALSNVFGDFCYNVEIFFANLWAACSSTFWNFIGDVLTGLADLQPAIDALAKFMRIDSVNISGFASSAYSKASAAKSGAGNYRDLSASWDSGMNTHSYKDIGEAWSSGWGTMDFKGYDEAIDFGMNFFGDDFGSYGDIGDAWSSGFNAVDYLDLGKVFEKGSSLFGNGLVDWNAGDAYKEGFDWGAGIKDIIDAWGNGKLADVNVKLDGLFDKFSFNNIGESLGLDMDSMVIFPNGGGLDATSPTDLLSNLGDLGGAGKGDGGVGDKLGKIKDDTESISDSMALTEEDLEYLRKIAAMEWKKEYNNSTIKIDMNNNNTINSDSDLDGIVTKLAEKLYDELASVADGVYA